MPKTLFKLVLCAVLVVIAQPSWATEINRCESATGEVSYQANSCDDDSFAAQQARTADLRAQREEVEAIQKDIMRVKRELMDLDRYYEFTGRDLDEEASLLLRDWAIKERQALHSKLNDLQSRRSNLMGLLFRVSS